MRDTTGRLKRETDAMAQELAEWRSGERKREPETRFDEYETVVAKMNQELAEWRSGKRRVVWRVRWFNGNHGTPIDYDHETRAHALHEARHLRSLSYNSATRNATVKLYRVTVGPAKKPAKKKEAG